MTIWEFGTVTSAYRTWTTFLEKNLQSRNGLKSTKHLCNHRLFPFSCLISPVSIISLKWHVELDCELSPFQNLRCFRNSSHAFNSQGFFFKFILPRWHIWRGIDVVRIPRIISYTTWFPGSRVEPVVPHRIVRKILKMETMMHMWHCLSLMVRCVLPSPPDHNS